MSVPNGYAESRNSDARVGLSAEIIIAIANPAKASPNTRVSLGCRPSFAQAAAFPLPLRLTPDHGCNRHTGRLRAGIRIIIFLGWGVAADADLLASTGNEAANGRRVIAPGFSCRTAP